ncbi:MAG: pyruvate dehydrogenase (acetyl-transferring), homodimeric type, partial [Mycobacterium sp.]|nr:pyruvate dehydrogenase (acetyl-transferring), homodimeric type [Mycobacterium sp.]
SGVAMPSALRAAELLAAEWDVAADVWSVTSWSELNRDGVAIEKEKLRHPDRPAGVAYVTQVLSEARSDNTGPFIAVSDWMRAVPEQIRPWVPGTYVTLGTDGFGFSDTRPAARRYFNTDAESQVVAVLEALARDGEIDPSVPAAAARQYKIDDVQAAPAQTSDPGVA